jgi:hypothetical protein
MTQVARKIVRLIESDISDRSGLGDEWTNIDDDTRAEILDKWAGIIDREIGKKNEAVAT